MKNGRKYPKSVILAAVFVAIVAVVAIWYAMSGINQISFSEEYAQKRLSKGLPYRGHFNKLVLDFGVTVNEIKVDFLDNNKIHVITSGEVKTKHGDAKIIVESVGTPDYRQGAFYFLPESLILNEFKLSELAQQNADKYGKIVKSATKKYFGEILDEAGVKIDADKISEKLKAGAKESVQNTLTRFFYTHPVRELEGVEGEVLKLAIKNIEADSGKLTIHFSLIQFTFNILLIILASIVAVFLVLTGPWWLPALFPFA